MYVVCLNVLLHPFLVILLKDIRQDLVDRLADQLYLIPTENLTERLVDFYDLLATDNHEWWNRRKTNLLLAVIRLFVHYALTESTEKGLQFDVIFMVSFYSFVILFDFLYFLGKLPNTAHSIALSVVELDV